MALSQTERARQFAALHVAGQPLQLVNCWDAGSARVIAGSGVHAVATSSRALAEAVGYKDGQALPFEQLLHIIGSICSGVDLPVSADIEAGYADDLATLNTNIEAVVRSGAIGINFEDGQRAGKAGLVDADWQAERIASILRTTQMLDVPLFINARTDTFILDATPTEATVEETLRRANIYREAGAHGIFVPGLVQPDWIERVAKEIKLPLNIMLSSKTPRVPALAALGAARISMGTWPFEQMRARLRASTEQFLREGDPRAFS